MNSFQEKLTNMTFLHHKYIVFILYFEINEFCLHICHTYKLLNLLNLWSGGQ